MSFPRTPRLLFSTAPFFRRPVRAAFEAAARSGFSGVEIMVTRDPDTQDAERLAALADAYDLQIGAIHAPFLVFTRRVWGTDPQGKIERAMALASAAGVPVVVAHPPYRWQRSYREWLERDLPRRQRETGVVVAVENMFPIGIGLHGAHALDDLARFPDVTLDTSHAGVAKLDLFETAEHINGRLRHVHLSNNRGRGWDSHAPVDRGVLPVGEFVERLGDLDYRGAISLELDLRPWMHDSGGLRDELQRQRRFCERRLATASVGRSS